MIIDLKRKTYESASRRSNRDAGGSWKLIDPATSFGLDVPKEVKSSGHFLFLPTPCSLDSAGGEATEWNRSPPENLRLCPRLDFWEPRGLQDQQEQFRR
jgi:hypothetical protein